MEHGTPNGIIINSSIAFFKYLPKKSFQVSHFDGHCHIFFLLFLTHAMTFLIGDKKIIIETMGNNP